MSQPKATLLSWTRLPLEVVFAVWESSKTEAPLRTPDQIKQDVPDNEIVNLFRAVIAQHIPVGEHIDLVYMLENVSISWREQAVRHRIGTTASPERLGVDIVPDLADSSFWSQSMRIQNMGKFSTNAAYRMPDSVKANSARAIEIFKETMNEIQIGYNKLIDMGVPMEDARELIPLGAQHRISWRLNISSLGHIVGKRSCWILQGGIWQPIIEGMINEAAEKIHPVFRELVTPPCIKGDSFNGCVYMEECRRRLAGEDKLPPCPLHLTHHTQLESEIPMYDEMVERAKIYKEFWGRDTDTGERINK